MSLIGIGEIGMEDFEKLDYLFKEYIPKHKEIWLFGLGEYAVSFQKYLESCDVDICGFVVSNNANKQTNKQVLSIEEFKNYYSEHSKGSIALLLTISSKYYGEVYPKLMSLGNDLLFIKNSYLQYAAEHCKNFENITLSIPVTEYCQGILCYGCTSAVPIIKDKNIYAFEQFVDDMKKIKQLIGSKISNVNFTGGDVFLHPRLIEFVEFTRKLYPNVLITFSINGVLLAKQTKEFWTKIGKNNVTLNWTLYPIKYDDMEETLNIFNEVGGIKLQINGDGSGEDKNSWKIPFSQKRQEKYDWLLCRHHKCSNNVMILFEGTLGVCQVHRELVHLVNKFNDKLSDEFKNATLEYNKQILNVKDITSDKEIEKYMTMRPSMCDFCALRERKNMGKWLCSSGKYEEWFVD